LSARLAALESAVSPTPAPAPADDEYSACIIRPAPEDGTPPRAAPVEMSPPPTVSTPARSPADDQYSASIIRSPAPQDAAPPPAALPPVAPPIPAAPMRRRKSAMRYWAGQPAPGSAYEGERIRGVQERRHDTNRGIRAV
jgi:hypothetical protein